MIFKPTIESVPLADGLRWRGGDFLYQEKSDGRHEFAELPGCLVNAERMKDGSLIVNDLVTFQGEDMRPKPTRSRWACLLFAAAIGFPDNTRLCRIGDGGQFLQRLLLEGSEGLVAKPLDSAFGVGWIKCKRSQVYFARVTDLDPSRGSAILADRDTGEPRGRVALHNRFDRVRVGSVLKLEAFGLHRSGLLREARLDRDSKDSWLVRI